MRAAQAPRVGDERQQVRVARRAILPERSKRFNLPAFGPERVSPRKRVGVAFAIPYRSVAGASQPAINRDVPEQPIALAREALAAVRAFAALPESPALAAANKRISNILKKAGEVDAHVNPELLQEQAEKDLYAAMQRFVPEADAQFAAGDHTASLQTLAVLRAPVDAFFDDVMVNAEQLDLRLNRLGLLKSLHDAMNRVADLSRLAV